MGDWTSTPYRGFLEDSGWKLSYLLGVRALLNSYIVPLAIKHEKHIYYL